MPIEVLWDEQVYGAIRFDVWDEWYWVELADGLTEAHRMRAEREIHFVIVNHLPGSKAPFRSFWEARGLIERMYLDVIIINVGGGALIAETIQIMSFLYPRFGARIKVAKTLALAYALCAKIEPSFAAIKSPRG